MVTSINTSGITVGTDGKPRISGLTSGIDYKAIIDAQITAKRAPAVQLETKISKNSEVINALGELKTKTKSFTTSLDLLRGQNVLLGDNVFATKTATGSTAATTTAPVSHVPSDIGDLLTVSVEQTATNATHTINIQQLAKAHQIRGGVQTSSTTALTYSGTFTLNGETITVAATDTLNDIRGKINAADTGVTASVISASSSAFYLVLTADETGTTNAIDLSGGNTLTDTLGLTDATTMGGGGDFAFEQVEAQDAILTVDGITGITRSTNQIDDVITGVTLDLLKAEADTDITFQVKTDLNAVKTALVDFVTNYNELRGFIVDQRTASDRNEDGTVSDSEFGPLFNDTTMRQILTKLGDFTATEMSGNTDGFRSLGQIGITTNEDYELEIDETILDSKLLSNVSAIERLFTIQTSSSDARLSYLGHGVDTVSGTYTVNIMGTDGSGNLLAANIGGAGSGADDDSVDVSGKNLTATDATNANGLSLFFNGGASLGAVSGITFTISRGIADQFFDFFDGLVATSSGNLDTRVTELQEQSTDYQDRIDVIDVRLEITRATLEAKFSRMETALASLNQLKERIKGAFQSDSNN